MLAHVPQNCSKVHVNLHSANRNMLIASNAGAKQSCSRNRSTMLNKCMGLTEVAVHQGPERTVSGCCYRAGVFEAANWWQYHQRRAVDSAKGELC